jgi:hypothetical protein
VPGKQAVTVPLWFECKDPLAFTWLTKSSMSLLMQLLVFLGLFGNLTLPVTSVCFLSSLFLHLSHVILTACFAFPSVPLTLLCQIFQIEELLPGRR